MVGMGHFHLSSKDPSVITELTPLASCIITDVKFFFARHGILNTVMHYNSPCFNCKEFEA